MRRLVKQTLVLWLHLASLLLSNNSLVECKKDITVFPTTAPTNNPTTTPTTFPAPIIPTEMPSTVPSGIPSTASPTLSLSPFMSNVPTNPDPSSSPSTASPSTFGSFGPSTPPSLSPSVSGSPTAAPSTSAPTITASPTKVPPLPTNIPSYLPSFVPSEGPSESIAPTVSLAPSVEPSDNPSLQPTETTAPSPAPTQIPSVSPSLTQLPSATPSLSQIPSESSSPSRVPSTFPSEVPSDLPTATPSSNSPSRAPSFGPTNQSSISPTTIPTSVPSSAPTVTLKDIGKAVIELMLINMPVLVNDSDIFIWEEITSAHVFQYWEKQPLPVITVQQVSTKLLQQQEEVVRRRRIQITSGNRVSYFYSQDLTFGTLRPNSLTENDIFMRPFDRDESAYTIALLSALGLPLDTDLTIAGTVVIEDGTPAPSPLPFTPTVSPMDAPSDGGGISTNIIVVVVVLALLAFFGTMLVVYNYYRRSKQQRNHEAWTLEQQRAEHHGEGDFGMRDPPTQISIQPSNQYQHQTSRGAGGAFPSSDEESDIEPFSVAAGSNLMNDGDDSFFAKDEYDDPPQAYGDSSQREPLASSLLGGEYDTDDEHDLNGGEQLMSAPLDGISRGASYGSSVDDGPSLAAFNVTVTDIDDEIDNL